MDSIAVVQRVAEQCALDQANAGVMPDAQIRDPQHLARIVCAWCNQLIRYAVWPQTGGLVEHTSHGICSVCYRKYMEAYMSAFMSEEEYWAEQKRFARIESKVEGAAEKADTLADEIKRLDVGLGEQGQATMALRDDMRQGIASVQAQIHEVAKELMALAMYVREKNKCQEKQEAAA
jgi:hypothetical protein